MKKLFTVLVICLSLFLISCNSNTPSETDISIDTTLSVDTSNTITFDTVTFVRDYSVPDSMVTVLTKKK